jgi:hypothetical protein
MQGDHIWSPRGTYAALNVNFATAANPSQTRASANRTWTAGADPINTREIWPAATPTCVEPPDHTVTRRDGPKQLQIVVIHRQREGRSQDSPPCGPARAAEPRAKQIRISEGQNDVDHRVDALDAT